jgi:hypothetical protein
MFCEAHGCSGVDDDVHIVLQQLAVLLPDAQVLLLQDVALDGMHLLMELRLLQPQPLVALTHKPHST